MDELNASFWPEEHDDDPNAFLRESLGPVFDERPSGIGLRDKYGCTRWIAFACLYTRLPQSGVSTLDLLRAADPKEYESVRDAARIQWLGRKALANEGGVVEVPEKLTRDEWESRYSPEARARDERICAAVRERGIALEPALEPEMIGLSASADAWEQQGTAERAILDALGLTIQEARTLVARFNAGRAPDRRWVESR